MTGDEATLTWHDGRLHRTDDNAAVEPIEVADSFLVDDGRVRALNEHRERFTASARDRDVDFPDIAAFWGAAVDRLPRHGRWFPRIEIRGRRRPVPAIRLRPAPDSAATATLVTLEGDDPRTAPTIKGPDLARLLDIRNGYHSATGADEAVILTDGIISDATTSALVWWRDDTLCAPADDVPRIDSITARCLRILAADTGTPFRGEHAGPVELENCEVWILNALRGIRRVTVWVGGPRLTFQAGRAEAWRSRLEDMARVLPPQLPGPGRNERDR